MFNLNFLIILFMGFVDYLGIGLVYPIFAMMIFDTEASLLAAETSAAYRGAVLGILMGLTPLSAFLFAPFLGSFSDCRGRKKTLIFGMVMGCLGYSLAVWSICYHSLLLLFVSRILIGITEGSAAVAQAAIADISTESNKARRFSLFSASAGLGFTVGPFLGGKLADPAVNLAFSYATPFALAGILCFVNLALLCIWFPSACEVNKRLSFHINECFRNISKIFAWKHLTWLFISSFWLSFAWAFFNEFMPVLLLDNFSFTLNDVGNYFAWGGVWYSLSSGLITAPLSTRVAADKLVLGALGGASICMAVFSTIDDARYIWWVVPLLMCCLALAFPTLASLISNKVDSGRQGEVLGVYHSIQGCAMGLSPLLAGAFIGAYPTWTGWGGALIMLMSCIAFRMGFRTSCPLESVQ